MKLPRYMSISQAEADGYCTKAMAGRMWSVDRRQVHTWSVRRDKNGFPPHRALYVAGGRIYPLFRCVELISWHEKYLVRPAVDTAMAS